MNVFYSKEIEKHKITLRDQEAVHCTKVLRKKKGAEVYVIDGQGGRYRCEIDELHKKSVQLTIKETQYQEVDELLPHLAFGLIKNATRLEWMLEKVTEIGVRRITPLIGARCERRQINHDRLNKILISAMKQSLRYHLPILDEPIKIKDFLSRTTVDNGYIASYGEGIPELGAVMNKVQSATLLIGPEGDFTTEEVQLSEKAGFQRVNLGDYRLRAETAAVVSTTIVNYK